MKFACAFAGANIVTSVCYQVTVETLIWKSEPQRLEAGLSGAGPSEATA